MPPKKSKAKAVSPSPAPAGKEKDLKGMDQDVVVRLAYELYLRRGGEHGHDVEDWLTAEQMLLEKQKPSGPGRRAADASRRVEDKFRRH
jgi:hypothetical protein